MKYSDKVKAGIELCVELASEGFYYEDFSDLITMYEENEDYEMCEAIKLFLDGVDLTERAIQMRLMNELTGNKRDIKKTYE